MTSRRAPSYSGAARRAAVQHRRQTAPAVGDSSVMPQAAQAGASSTAVTLSATARTASVHAIAPALFPQRLAADAENSRGFRLVAFDVLQRERDIAALDVFERGPRAFRG